MGRGRRQGYQKVNSKNKTTPRQKTKTEIKIKNQENQIGKKGKGKKTKENLKWKKEKKKRKMPQNKARLNRTRIGGCVGGGLRLLERKGSQIWGGLGEGESSEQLAQRLGMNVVPQNQKQTKPWSPIVSEIFKNHQQSQGAKLPPRLAIGNVNALHSG